MKPPHARAHWTSTRAPKWGVRVWSNYNFTHSHIYAILRRRSPATKDDLALPIQLHKSRSLDYVQLWAEFYRPQSSRCASITTMDHTIQFRYRFIIRLGIYIIISNNLYRIGHVSMPGWKARAPTIFSASILNGMSDEISLCHIKMTISLNIHI